MKENLDRRLNIRFEHSKKEADVPLSTLVDGAVRFLEFYGNAQFCGRGFVGIVGEGNGESKFSTLLRAAKYENDAMGFFSAVFEAIGSGRAQDMVLNDVPLPHMLLVGLLERVMPGHGYLSIKAPKRLEESTNLDIPDEQRSDLQKVMDKYPVRLSRHTIRQMMVSRDVAYQYMPFVEELDEVGHENTWIGQFHEGLLEQMYQNRVIFLLNMTCPVYCRFCFRKHKESRNENNPTVEDVRAAVAHVRKSPSIKEIVITGGDPFMNRANMAATIDGLMTVDHVQTLRLATRSVAYFPDLFLGEEEAYLKYLKQKSLELQQNGKRMELATHFIHPDEVSPESLYIISDLVKNGIAVYIQTPFLSDCNDTGPELVQLFHLLRGAGAELHYIYIPCSPIHGNSIYWKPLSDGIYMAKYLRAHLSDRVMPRICTATPIGKMDWHTSGWAVERVADNENFVWIRTPYTPAYFKAFTPVTEKLSNIRTNAEGTLDIQYLAKIGDDALFLGNRPSRMAPKNTLATVEEIQELRVQLSSECQTRFSVVDTGLENIDRLHETRVLLVADQAGEAELDYIKTDFRITDVVITAHGDVVDHLYDIYRLVRRLQDISHVNAVRLRSVAFAATPEAYTLGVVNTLGDLNRLTVADPLRLEIETWFVTDGDVKPIHAAVASRLNNKGITVYANVPLFGGVNDTDTVIHDLAYALRRSGIEFHHLYVAGLPLQRQWNVSHPVDSYDVVDIATMVRREGSGREIPRYIIATPLGEVDYGLTSEFIREGDAVKVKLTCYDEAYYRFMSPDFVFPAGVEKSLDGRPVLALPGLVKTNDFPIS